MKRIQGLSRAALAAVAMMLPAAHAADSGWRQVRNLAPVVGADGHRHQATCSGFPATNPAFSFWAKRGAAKNLVVFFEGGGACWDGFTCSYPIDPRLPPQAPQFFQPAVPANNNPSQLDGIFNDDNPANPVKDWSFVYIPYCTGDLHAGSSTQTYTSPTGNAALQIPPGYTFTLHHKGFDNFMVVLDWIKKNIDTPKRVLVTGVSGGGYGASINFPWVAQTYPNAHLYVIADSSQGVTPPGWDVSPVGRGHWNLQLAPWVFGNNPALVRSADVLSIGALTYSHAKVAQFTTAQDAVQTGFYGLMRSEGYPTGGTCPLPPPDWNELMLGALQLHAATVPNYRYYVAGGSYHTILESPSFYTEASPGSTYSDWVAGMLANRGGTNGSGGHWHSEACPTCLTPLPCQ